MKNFACKEIKDNEDFDPSSFYASIPFTQAGFYGDWQKSLGRTVKRFLIYKNTEIVAYFQIITYPLVFGKSYFYIPYGPIIKDFSDDCFDYVKQELRRMAKSEDAIFIRLDFTPTTISNNTLAKFFTKAPRYTYHSVCFQPRREWFLGLEKSENDLLMAMHKTTRYSIRLADKKEIRAEIISEDFEKYFEAFYALMLGTAKRNGFSLHAKKYYENIFKNLSKIKNSYVSIARYGQKILAIDLIIVFGGIANYVFGCSSDEGRNCMPAYSAHWKAVLHAKQLGCNYYNFGGIEDESNLLNKGMITLTLHKKKFGGQEVKHSDFFDIMVQPFWYYLYNMRKLIKTII